MLTRNRTFLLSFLAAALILPMNIYVIGDATIGAGLQSPLVRFQQTYVGTSVITVFRDFDYVASGIITGRSALSILLQLCGTALLVGAVVYFAVKRQEDYRSFRKSLALLVGGAGGAYLLSCLTQFGPLLHGPAGLSIPVGVPLILAVAGYILKVEDDEDEYDEETDEDYGEETGEEE